MVTDAVMWGNNDSMKSSESIFQETNEKSQRHRQALAVSVLVLIIIIPIIIVQFSSRMPREVGLPQILFEDSIRVIALGEYISGEVDIPDASEGMFNMWQIQTEILDWGNCSEPLQRWCGLVKISLNEFLTLDMSEIDEFIYMGETSITRENPTSGGGWSGFLGNDMGLYVWFFKYNCTDLQIYSIAISITVSIQCYAN